MPEFMSSITAPLLDAQLFGGNLSVLQLGLALLAAFAAGFIDSIAGGGGIITVPVLMGIGIPPHLSLGTNKLQASFGSLTAAIRYSRRGLASPKTMAGGIFWTFVGAAGGTLAIQGINPDFLNRIIPVLLIGVFVYMLAKPDVSEITQAPKLKEPLFYLGFGLLLGFYDGFFGPGTGSFWTIAFVGLLGMDLKHATGSTKVMNLTSNLVSLGVFAIAGSIAPALGLLMGLLQVSGAYLGSHVVIHRGTRLIRWIFLTMVGVTIINLLLKQVFTPPVYQALGL
ncbi:TSUP family transporter [Spirochaeta lutea]|uniref:TSUP family transporter n=1 Tax=Spirochaeta lutea TaxID=1480694 RepID=UPI001930AB6A|nr:TSUP family transporter [Spirochaeta lutea]